MKKVAIGVMAILSLSLVGCSKEKLDVNFEKYFLKDSEDGSTMVECIDVNVNANEISNNTLNQILDGIGNKNMDTEIIVNNIQGVQIAKVTEKNNKVTMNIDEEYKSNKKYDVEFKKLDEMKESVDSSRSMHTETLLEGIDEAMSCYNSIVNGMRETKDMDDKYLKEMTKIFYDTKELGLEQITNKSKDFKDDEHVKEATEILFLTQKDYKKMIQYGKEYQKNKLDRDLESFKGALLEFRGHIATYKMQVSSLDE